MIYLSAEELDRLIEEDVPYFDLTSHVLGIRENKARISLFTRESAIISGTDEVLRIFERVGIQAEGFVAEGASASPGDVIMSGTGKAEALHHIWKVSQNILDRCSGIATQTRHFVEDVQSVNQSISVLTTRKGFPGTKKLAIKAILAGGALPHRLGLSETILIFKQHIDMIGGFPAMLQRLPAIKAECCEKKIIVEATSGKQALEICGAGADGIQFDKLSPEELFEAATNLKQQYPEKIVLAAGGIHGKNAKQFAKAPINGIVTSSLYDAKPIDVGVRMECI